MPIGLGNMNYKKVANICLALCVPFALLAFFLPNTIKHFYGTTHYYSAFTDCVNNFTELESLFLTGLFLLNFTLPIITILATKFSSKLVAIMLFILTTLVIMYCLYLSYILSSVINKFPQITFEQGYALHMETIAFAVALIAFILLIIDRKYLSNPNS